MTKPIMLPKSSLTEAQLACVDLLSEALEQAQGGKIDAVGIIVCLKGGYATVMAGTQAADLNLGCDSLKRKIMDALETGNARMPSSLIRGQ